MNNQEYTKVEVEISVINDVNELIKEFKYTTIPSIYLDKVLKVIHKNTKKFSVTEFVHKATPELQDHVIEQLMYDVSREIIKTGSYTLNMSHQNMEY